MEATKKKKAYLKPEMNRFEMKMEAPFLSGSYTIVIPETEVQVTIGDLSNGCIDPENPLVLGPGDCGNFYAHPKNNQGLCGLWDKMIAANIPLKQNSPVKLCHNTDGSFTATLLVNTETK